MNFTYENQGSNTYLVYSLESGEELDTLSLGMLTNNKIPGLAATSFMQIDTDKYIKYNVTAKIPVSQFFAGQVNKKRLVGVFKGIVNAMLSAEEYMIDPETIILELDYIFADVSTCDTVLVCLPVYGAVENTPELGQFFKNIMFGTQFDQTENCDHIAKIMNYLNSTPVFSLADFKSVLDSVEGNAFAAPAAQPQVAPSPAPVPGSAPAPKTVLKKPAAQPQPTAQPQAQPQPAQTPRPAQPAAPAPQAKPAQPAPQPAARPAPQANAGFAVPEQTSQPMKSASAAQDTGEKMSLMYLLQHYNKENADLYKAQKEARKNGTASAPQSAYQPAARPASQPSVGFAVPGQSAPAPTPAPAPAPAARPAQSSNGGFAIPGQPAPAQRPAPAPQPQAAPAPGPAYQPAAPQPSFNPAQPAGTSASFGETTVLGGGGNIGETTVLSGAPQAKTAMPFLVRSKNNEKIPLNKPVFRLGKERSYVDYFIGDNTAISRSHANIISKDGKYYVMDMNSTNHTFVDGDMINSSTEVEITHGSKIRLANEDFEFRMF